MKYVSTRGNMPEKSFTEVLLMGLCPDGGLAVPKVIPKLSSNELEKWQNLSYQDLCYEIFIRFIDDIPKNDLKAMIHKVYSVENFKTDEITPLRFLDSRLAILGLSNGPTFAFKDIAMQMIGELFEYVLGKEDKKLNIVGATSGDTGSAAEYAMIGKKNVNIFMLSPYQRMSAFQQAQMFTLDEPNIFNISLKGVFDDCQDIVKAINNDLEFKEKYHIGAVNSINWARILAQVVYYFKGYFSACTKTNDPISFCVPSGNFGDVYAGYVAKQMGLPIKKLIVATNENDVLNEFFNTGTYKIRPSEEVLKTTSPSMDIGKASNFERYIYNLFANDSEIVSGLWSRLESNHSFSIGDQVLIKDSGFISGMSIASDRIQTIQSVYENYQEIIDPHTADGVYVAKKKATKGLTICLETALPIKFEETIKEALGFVPEKESQFFELLKKEKKYQVVDNQVADVRAIIEANSK